MELGFNPNGDAQELKRGFLRLDAMVAVVEEENRRRELQASIFHTQGDATVESGLEYPTADGDYAPRLPKLKFADPNDSEMEARIQAKERELAGRTPKAMTKEQREAAFRQEMLSTDATDIAANILLPDGRRYDAVKAEEARVEQARERRARASQLGLSRGS